MISSSFLSLRRKKVSDENAMKDKGQIADKSKDGKIIINKKTSGNKTQQEIEESLNKKEEEFSISRKRRDRKSTTKPKKYSSNVQASC